MLTQNNVTVLFNFVLGVAGSAIMALGIAIFLAPADIVPMGVGGLGVIANTLFGLPIGVVAFVANIPIFWLSYRELSGGWRMLGTMLVMTIVYSATIDLFALVIDGVYFSDDRLLNAIFGGVMLGIGGGVVYRSGTVVGGTYALALILRRRRGTPMSTTYFYTDTGILAVAALIFGMEGALYAAVVLFLNGIAQDYIMEGPSVVRTGMIVTNKAEPIARQIMAELQVGVTRTQGEGMYSGEARDVLYVTVSRANAPRLREIVSEQDEHAFLVIMHGHEAYGGGFKQMVRQTAGIPVPIKRSA